MLRRTLFVVAAIGLMLLALGCASATPQIVEKEITRVVEKPAAPTAAPKSTVKYLFIFIGDGMGVAQRNSAELYLAASKSAGDRPEKTKLVMNTFPAQGVNTTYDLTSVIPDSASTATAIATGYKTASGVIGMDGDGKIKYETITEAAKKKGWKVGVLSSVSLDHATPAAFYAHVASRSKMYDIAQQLATSNFDYFAGGGLVQPKGKTGDQPDVMDAIKAAGYKVVIGRSEFAKLTPSAGKVVVMDERLDADKAQYYAIDQKETDLPLAELVKKGIDLLDNPTGFIMAVEGGKIDWACHANDAAASIHDTLALDAAIAEAVKFYERHPQETLIIVTGDHETGGMTIGFAGTKYAAFFDKIKHQKMSYLEFGKKLDEYKKTHTPATARFDEITPLLKDAFGLSVLTAEERAQLQARAKNKDKEAEQLLGMSLSDLEVKVLQEAFAETMKDVKVRAADEYTYLLYGGYEPLAVKLTTILNQKAGIGWTSYSHTGVPVQTSALGVGQDMFNGYYDQTDIYKKMVALTGLGQ